MIIAEGALSERFIDDDSRGMFHNAHEYRALYRGCSDGGSRDIARRGLMRATSSRRYGSALRCAPD